MAPPARSVQGSAHLTDSRDTAGRAYQCQPTPTRDPSIENIPPLAVASYWLRGDLLCPAYKAAPVYMPRRRISRTTPPYPTQHLSSECSLHEPGLHPPGDTFQHPARLNTASTRPSSYPTKPTVTRVEGQDLGTAGQTTSFVGDERGTSDIWVGGLTTCPEHVRPWGQTSRSG